jgi:hypothetical protein
MNAGRIGNTLAYGRGSIPSIFRITMIMPTTELQTDPFAVPFFHRRPPRNGTRQEEARKV